MIDVWRNYESRLYFWKFYLRTGEGGILFHKYVPLGKATDTMRRGAFVAKQSTPPGTTVERVELVQRKE